MSSRMSISDITDTVNADTVDESSRAETKALEESEIADEPTDGEPEAVDAETQRNVQRRWARAIAFGILPAVAMLLAVGASYLKWRDTSAQDSHRAAVESVRAAVEDTAAMLSYRPDTAEKDLTAARDRMTGSFRDAYMRLITEVVIPGAKQKHVSSVATVPAAASVSATGNRAVVLVFVNQTITLEKDPPTSTASSVRVTLDKVGDKWLISGFDPV